MSRYHFIALATMVILSLMGEAESLASIIRNVRRRGILGAFGGKRDGFPQPTNYVATLTTEPVQPSWTQEVEGLDIDQYRREMRDLVYQRNLERGFSS